MAPATQSKAVVLALGAAAWVSSTEVFVAPRLPAVTQASRSGSIGFDPSIEAEAAPALQSILALGGGFTAAFGAAVLGRIGMKRQRTSMMALSQDELKKQAGYKAVDDYVRSGTVIGLGTGSTAAFAVERVGEKLKSGELKDIIAIPTSIRTQEQSEALGIPLATLDTHSDLDVAIDGADEVDPGLNLVKGGGGALFREKIVEMCAKKFIVIVDESKLCDGLGPGFPVPVEIVPFCHEHTMRVIAKLPALEGCEPVLRFGNVANNKPDGDKPAVTDNGNYIVDLKFTTPIKDPVAAGEQLKATVGVVDHGLFTGMTTACIVAGKDGVYVKEAK
eukprot:TRINITY_DN19030_c0_g1_i1.p1 TRINITY_DN19030_c0_g1~~TRINITY_DN19030_c0_g1_i1.p1  ORF type:complete len:345 (-),score=75.43 TRINITY_DN19030_c0_g1_i1:92-1090(-)